MQKKVSFKNSKGQRLVGVLHIPKGKGSFPTVIVQHGFRSNHQEIFIKSIAKGLEKNGFIALRFSLSGYSPSGGSYKDVLVSQAIKDIGSAIKFLLKIPQVNKYRIGITGHSMGGFAALASAHQYSKFIRSVVSISCYYNVKELQNSYVRDNKVDEVGKDYWIISGFKLTNKHFKDRAYLVEKDNIKNIHCPVLILHGDKDKRADVKDAYSIYNLLGEPRDLKIIKEADHNFNNPFHIKKVVNLTTNWFKKYLAFKVSKVVNVFIEHNGKVLILKRSQKVGTHRGLWCSVGGYLESQNILKNARQEVNEELGLRIKDFKNYKLGKSFKVEEKKIDRIWQVHPVLFKLKSKPKIKLDWENTDYRWVKPSEVKKFKRVPMLDRALEELGLIND